MSMQMDSSRNLLFIRQDNFLGAMKELESTMEASIVGIEPATETIRKDYPETYLQVTLKEWYTEKNFDLLLHTILVEGFQTVFTFFDPKNPPTGDDSEEKVLKGVYDAYIEKLLRQNMAKKVRDQEASDRLKTFG